MIGAPRPQIPSITLHRSAFEVMRIVTDKFSLAHFRRARAICRKVNKPVMLMFLNWNCTFYPNASEVRQEDLIGRVMRRGRSDSLVWTVPAHLSREAYWRFTTLR